MPDRSGDWLHQAERDVEHAEDSHRGGRHEWACFAAQQAAEKAVEALHLRPGEEAWGHVVARLLAELPAHAAASWDLIEKARVLDTFYIPARYPNSHAAGAPLEHYVPAEALVYTLDEWNAVVRARTSRKGIPHEVV